MYRYMIKVVPIAWGAVGVATRNKSCVKSIQNLQIVYELTVLLGLSWTGEPIATSCYVYIRLQAKQ